MVTCYWSCHIRFYRATVLFFRHHCSNHFLWNIKSAKKTLTHSNTLICGWFKKMVLFWYPVDFVFYHFWYLFVFFLVFSCFTVINFLNYKRLTEPILRMGSWWKTTDPKAGLEIVENTLPKPRVTIFLKAKIGTMVGEISRDEIYGPSNLFFAKSGTLRCGSGLDSRSRVIDAKTERKIGVISKKKKRSSPYCLHDQCEFPAPECYIMLAKPGVTFFFFWRSPQFFLILLYPHLVSLTLTFNITPLPR